ncbi:acyl-CoA carboxylase subunit epsilon [Microbacterium sp. 1P10UB]|uniref:acyl-CoA carboxylase subunit epsilon n=1 Tax=unclassified Microbacterium TaxID=2609290 RepID=UPI0039A314FB
MIEDEGSDAAATADAIVPLSIDVRRGSPSPEELAALVAVVSEAYAMEAAAATASDAASGDAWRASQRGLRAPLRRDVGWARSGW